MEGASSELEKVKLRKMAKRERDFDEFEDEILLSWSSSFCFVRLSLPSLP